MGQAEPLIQIVDKEDRVIGSMSIGEAHKKGAIHRIARIILENPKNKKILLQKRALTMQRWPGCWDNSAAGHVDEGEDYLTAAKRELFEEIRVEADQLEEKGSYYSENKKDDGLVVLKRFNKVYRLFSEKDAKDFHLDKSEVDKVEWFSLDEIRQMLKYRTNEITDGMQDTIERYYS